MDRRSSILDGLGEEIIRIVSPVSLCMLLVVILVSILNNGGSDSDSSNMASLATLIYNEQTTDSSWDKFTGALLNALVFVVVVTLVTFLLVGLFYFRCVRFLKLYMSFAAFTVLGYMGGYIAVLLVQALSIPIDCVTFGIVLFNFTVVGVLSVFGPRMPIVFTQGYLVLIGILVAYWFAMLPEWTTWVLLVAMALYDVVAVLIPGGPLRLLVELAISRDEEIPALIYEARPVDHRGYERIEHENELASRGDSQGGMQRRGVWRQTADSRPSNGIPNADQERIVSNGEGGVNETVQQNQDEELTPLVAHNESSSSFSASSLPHAHNASQRVAPEEKLMERGNSNDSPTLSNAGEGNVVNIPNAAEANIVNMPNMPLLIEGVGVQNDGLSVQEDEHEGIGLSSSGAIKLGLGDFIFYSVLVGRAAMYDYMTVFACYLAIIAGLGATLLLLGLFRKALPALPVSISLGVIFYFLTRLVMEVFVVQVSTHLLMF